MKQDLEADFRNTVVIVIEGGCLQEIIVPDDDKPRNYVVIDYDNEKAGDRPAFDYGPPSKLSRMEPGSRKMVLDALRVED